MSRRSIKWLAVISLFTLAALGLYRWGAAVPRRYRVISATTSGTRNAPTEIGNGTTEWVISDERSDGERWTARDSQGDGTWSEFSTPRGVFARPSASSPHRWLIVCLDGVPLTMMQSLWDAGQFREFFRPTSTVSTVPSDTELALTTTLGAAPVPGYEHLYFDRANNSMRGGWWVTLSGYNIPYIRKLDYDPPGWSKGAPYLMTEKSYNADLARFRAAFLRSDQRIFLAHIAASDALLHMWTAQKARPLLIEFDDLMRELYLDGRGDLGVIVFSDHGNTEVATRVVPLEKFLRGNGWRLGDSLQTGRDVVIPAYGLVGFAAIYCRPESITELAQTLRGVDGADVIISHNPGENMATIWAAGSSAIGELQWSADGNRYRYAARDGDPIGLAAAFAQMRAADKLDAEGFAADSDLFAATASAIYPDAAARVRAWATGSGVSNPSDVILSFRPGYSYGASGFNYVVNLASTHGGLERSATLGFAMATFPLPSATRVGNVIPAHFLEAIPRR